MDESRRKFLKSAGWTVLGAGCAFPLLGAAAKVWEADGEAAAPAKQWGMVIDIQKCLRPEVRSACAEACRREHNVPRIPDADRDINWIWSTNFEDAFPDETHRYLADSLKNQPVLVLCNHCTEPPCVKVCPTEATWKRPQDGIVMMDMHRCIGCRYCMAACPYGSRSYNWEDPRPYIESIRPEYPTRTQGVVEKCNFCDERIREGRQPACVEAAAKVPGAEGALVFGNLADPGSDISRLLRREVTICRRPNLGTGPNVFYII
jgi:Fe-S-cluster-containing dehydrogenase component